MKSIQSLRSGRLAGLICCLTLSLAGGLQAADLEISGVFTDHMVLQRRMKVPVWGWANPGEKISVSIQNQTKSTVAAADGKWRANLDPMETGAPQKLTVKGEKASLEINDILLGEVWLCSGQSNMEWNLGGSKGGKEQVAAADFPDIRLFNLAKDGAGFRVNAPAERLQKQRWEICSPGSVAKFSAVAYYFARHLQADLKVPIGLISNPVGGSSIESWISRAAFEADPSLNVVQQYYDKILEHAKSPAGLQEIAKFSDEYEAKQVELKAAGKPPLWPFHYEAPKEKDEFTSVWFNTRVQPLIPFAMRGVIWYQGESNNYMKGNGNEKYAFEYRSLLPLLIKDWRGRWGQGDFPFLFVQLPNWGKASPDPVGGGGWPIIREAQLMTAKLPKTGMAVTIDVGDPVEIHPIDKQPVGERLGLVARAIAYDEKLVWSGPIYRGMAVEGSKIRLSFDHTGGGLLAKGGDLKQFAIAGSDLKFVHATAVIENGTVVVSAPEIHSPAVVRYGWQSNPEGCNLYNAEGLPASPFRTDNEPFESGTFYKKKLAGPVALESKL